MFHRPLRARSVRTANPGREAAARCALDVHQASVTAGRGEPIHQAQQLRRGGAERPHFMPALGAVAGERRQALYEADKQRIPRLHLLAWAASLFSIARLTSAGWFFSRPELFI